MVAILTILEKEQEEKSSFKLGVFFGLSFHFCSLYWIAIAFKTANIGGFYFGVLAVLLLSLFLSILVGTTFFLIKLTYKNKSLLFKALVIILFFSILDWIKGNILWGFPWLPISAIWTFHEITLAPFSFLGVWGYSMLTYFLIVGILFLKVNYRFSILLIIPFVTLFFVNENLLSKDKKKVGKISVRLIQPNIPQIEKWDKNKIKKNLQSLVSLTVKEKSENIDLVIWPETSVPFDINDNNENFLELKNKLKKINNLIFGGIRRENYSEVKIYNSLFFFKQNFKKTYVHNKLKLVPFGEFIPLRSFLRKKNITLSGIDFSKGNNINILEFNKNIKILPLICYEVIFPNITKHKSNDYNLIVNITNDAWYGKSKGPYQHFALAKIRAVQEGKYLLRVANTGISGIIDYNGNSLDVLAIDQKGIIDKELVLSTKNTMYSKFGDNIFLLLVIILLIILLVLNFRKGIKFENEN